LRIVRSLVVVTPSGRVVDWFLQSSLAEARNLKDFLKQTGGAAQMRFANWKGPSGR